MKSKQEQNNQETRKTNSTLIGPSEVVIQTLIQIRNGNRKVKTLKSETYWS